MSNTLAQRRVLSDLLGSLYQPQERPQAIATALAYLTALARADVVVALQIPAGAVRRVYYVFPDDHDDLETWAEEVFASLVPGTAAETWVTPPDGFAEAYVYAATDGADVALILGARKRGTLRPCPANLVTSLQSHLTWSTHMEVREQLYFVNGESPLTPALLRALRLRSSEGFDALAAVVADAVEADIVYWGTIEDASVRVTHAWGTYDPAFSFRMPVGMGMASEAIANGVVVRAGPDPYPRAYSPALPMILQEHIVTQMTVPVLDPIRNEPVALVYAARRNTHAFDPVSAAIAYRAINRDVLPARAATPLVKLRSPRSWRTTPSQVRPLTVDAAEEWAESFLGVPVVRVHHLGVPYSDRASQSLTTVLADSGEGVRPVLANGLGHLYLSPAPKYAWSEVGREVLTVLSEVLVRESLEFSTLMDMRKRWLAAFLQGSDTDETILREGRRLGVARVPGCCWVLRWDWKTLERHGIDRLGKWTESVTLDALDGVVIETRDCFVVLSEVSHRPDPGDLRKHLLNRVGSGTVWMVHGARYNTVAELRQLLPDMVRLAEDAETTRHASPYLRYVPAHLNALWTAPELSDPLNRLAYATLEPLLAYDHEHNSDLTETLATYYACGGSTKDTAQALFLHPNSVLYRVHRAVEILNVTLSDPEVEVTVKLAVLTWLRTRERET